LWTKESIVRPLVAQFYEQQPKLTYFGYWFGCLASLMVALFLVSITFFVSPEKIKASANASCLKGIMISLFGKPK